MPINMKSTFKWATQYKMLEKVKYISEYVVSHKNCQNDNVSIYDRHQVECRIAVPNLCPANVNITLQKQSHTLNPPKSKETFGYIILANFVKYNQFLQQPTEIFLPVFKKNPQSDVDSWFSSIWVMGKPCQGENTWSLVLCSSFESFCF